MRPPARGFERPCGADRLDDRGELVAAAVLERVADGRGLFRAAAFEDMDERQRGLSLAQVVAEVLSGLVQLPRIVEYVVDELERGPKMRPISGEPLLGAPVGRAEDSPDASGCLKEFRRLAPNHFE